MSGPLQEVWYLQLNHRDLPRALCLRFTVLCSRNGFRRVAETTAVHFQRDEGQAGRDVGKVAVKATHDFSTYRHDEQEVRIADCFFTFPQGLPGTGQPGRTTGTVQCKGRTVRWDLAIAAGSAGDLRFDLVPQGYQRARLVRSRAVTLNEDLRFTGTVQLDDQPATRWENAPGMLAHHQGRHLVQDWVWGQANAFVTEEGKPAPFIFEGMTVRGRWPLGLSGPRLSSFYFFYRDRAFRFNSVRDSIRLKSTHTLTDWEFQADRGDYSFRGKAKADYKDFAGLRLEDTDGSFLYSAHSKLSTMQIHVYRRGKLEGAFYARGTAALEVVSRVQSPYVPVLA